MSQYNVEWIKEETMFILYRGNLELGRYSTLDSLYDDLEDVEIKELTSREEYNENRRNSKG